MNDNIWFWIKKDYVMINVLVYDSDSFVGILIKWK